MTPSAAIEHPTLESTWLAVAGVPIADGLLEWPADLFALTSLILGRSQAYRFLFSLPEGTEWPPSRFANWAAAVTEAAHAWSEWADDRQGSMPVLLAEEWAVFRQRAGMSLEKLAEGADWRMCEALLTLHAMADEACAGLAVALDRSVGAGGLYRARGRELLARTGSLSRIRPNLLRVLPKLRIPPGDTTLGCFSRYASLHAPGVGVKWHKLPARHPGAGNGSEHANLLLLPWPLRVRESDFKPVEGSVRDQFGFFEFEPAESLDLDLVDRMIRAARDEAGSVDVVMFPESAVDESTIEPLEALLESHGVIMLVAGIRQRSALPGRMPGNWVHSGVSPRLEKGGPPPGSPGEAWFHVRQNKHHRWSLNEQQIYQYHLGGALRPDVRWWEAIDVPRQSLQIIEVGEKLTLVALICEDLTQNDEVTEIVRSVGPTCVLVPLLDGPQLDSRWAARYASVLADNPGSSVLTLTSYGMAARARPGKHDVSPVIGLWKDTLHGTREIPLERDAQGVLLTVCGCPLARGSADGRSPAVNASQYFAVSVFQVRAGPRGPSFTAPDISTRLPRPLEVEELTVLTGWAEAVAETIACAPDRIGGLLAEAKPGATWRSELGLGEPSPRLADSIASIGRMVQAAAARTDTISAFSALLATTQEGQKDEGCLDRLARTVLRSRLEHFASREASTLSSSPTALSD